MSSFHTRLGKSENLTSDEEPKFMAVHNLFTGVVINCRITYFNYIDVHDLGLGFPTSFFPRFATCLFVMI